jgi:hypothetical protein
VRQEADSLARRIDDLRGSVVYSIAISAGWMTPAEKIRALKSAELWDQARSRDQTDMLMAAGGYEEAIPRYAAFGHWRKVGDAYFALGNLAEARASYERGENLPGKEYKAFRREPDYDRLIALAIRREDWTAILAMIRQVGPESLGKSEVIFGGSSRAKGPLVKLGAHAAAAAGDRRMAGEMRRFFDLTEEEIAVILEHARSGAYAKDVAKLAKPPLLRVTPRSMAQIMAEGCTDRSEMIVDFLKGIEGNFRGAYADMLNWLDTGDGRALARVIFWLTQSGNFDVFKSCLFALQCEVGMFYRPDSRHVTFYTTHPWLTRASMRELLAALVAMEGQPSSEVLFSCVLQHSASIMPDIEKGTFDPDRVDPLVALRSHATWAEAVIARWSADGHLERLWAKVRAEATGEARPDVRRMPAFAKLCDALTAVLLDAWKRDFEMVRWKAEESAFLALQSLLPGVEIQRHAMPSWLAPQHLDILVPRAGVAVEYQGEQHYRPIDIFGGKVGFEATVRRDENKLRLCQLAGIQLEYIRFDEDAARRLKEIADHCRPKLKAGRVSAGSQDVRSQPNMDARGEC